MRSPVFWFFLVGFGGRYKHLAQFTGW